MSYSKKQSYKSFFWTLVGLSLFLSGCTEKPSEKRNPTRENEYVEIGCTEIMYNSGSDLEYIEFKITRGPAILDMEHAELRVKGAVKFEFPAEPLDTNEYAVLTNDPELFMATYPEFSGRLFGPWYLDEDGTLPKLPNEGDAIEIKLRGKGDVSCSFGGEPPWPSLSNGKGRSLVYIGGDPIHIESWAAHAVDGGNPGGPDTYIKPLEVRINEVMPFTAGVAGWVELYNSSDKSIDMSGWELEVVAKNQTFKLNPGTVIDAKGYLVLNGDEESGDFGEEGLYVGATGSDYYLREVKDGKMTLREASLKAIAGEASSGFVELADGSLGQGSLASPTPGTANEILMAGPVFINEINYHPMDFTDQVEFLELINKSDQDVELSSMIKGEVAGWKIAGIRMTFTLGAVIPANGLLLLVEETTNIEAFKAKYAIADDIPIHKYKGRLSNRGELLIVQKPFDFAKVNNKTEWFYSYIDAVLYSDNWEGMKEADGYGKSLHRTDYNSMGYEAGVWKIGDPSPGKP
ncbi:MAG: lamin tail domain-containing protein [Fibrobacter sp.]|nr:lamin tail domain-containing protein [Fibrobacter sp.]